MISRAFKRSFSTAGSLYTWGETTFGWGRKLTEQLRVPGKVGDFNDVTRIAAGPYHLIFARQNKQVYGVGLGTNGRLGVGNTQNVEEPKPIQSLQNVEIRQLAAGHRHSLALSTSGDVFAWGYGGRGGYLSSIPFVGAHSPVGFTQGQDVLRPRVIQSFTEKVKQIAAGKDLSLALGESGKVYGWGSGLCDLNEQASSTPVVLEQINYFLHSHHSHVKKMKSTGSNAFFLLDDGRLYVVGVNNGGVFATRQNPRIVIDSKLHGLTKIVDHDFKGEKIVKFKLSENSLIFLTDKGHVFYSGMHSKFRPERFPVEEGSVKTIFATYDSVGVIDKAGRIGYLNDEFISNSEKKDNVFLSRDENLKNTIKIGGAYKLRYALVQN